MSTFTAIRNKKQTVRSFAGVAEYVTLPKKTEWAGTSLISGSNCVPESSFIEMMTTKERFRKTDGRQFYQFVQSFSPEESVSPEEVHAIGLELAQRLFPEYEVLVATHVDVRHLHNHLVVNSVSFKDGRKDEAAENPCRIVKASDEAWAEICPQKPRFKSVPSGWPGSSNAPTAARRAGEDH